MQVKIYIRKDGFIASRPWSADLELDGKVHRSWLSGWRTKKALVTEISAIAPNAEVTNV